MAALSRTLCRLNPVEFVFPSGAVSYMYTMTDRTWPAGSSSELSDNGELVWFGEARRGLIINDEAVSDQTRAYSTSSLF